MEWVEVAQASACVVLICGEPKSKEHRLEACATKNRPCGVCEVLEGNAGPARTLRIFETKGRLDPL
jgi:hypothetical protein